MYGDRNLHSEHTDGRKRITPKMETTAKHNTTPAEMDNFPAWSSGWSTNQ